MSDNGLLFIAALCGLGYVGISAVQSAQSGAPLIKCLLNAVY